MLPQKRPSPQAHLSSGLGVDATPTIIDSEEQMTDYETLYAQFQLKARQVSELQTLYDLHERQSGKSEKILVTTSVSDRSGTKIVNSEVANAKLV